MLGGIFEGCGYRDAKGIIEALLQKLNIDYSFVPSEENGFAAGKCISIQSEKTVVGHFGFTENSSYIYYELSVNELFVLSQKPKIYSEISKYPPQIEDITLTFPEKTLIGNVVDSIKSADKLVNSVELKDIFKDAYTFRIEYHDINKTLTDDEVEEIRNKILSKVKEMFGGQIKE
jgi:phenylalanyl-tRNA synthetase beta subunit